MPDAAISPVRTAPATRSRQGVIGLSLAGAIFTAWLAIHIYAIFVFELSWSTLPVGIAIALVQCWLSVGVFIISHDAMHGSLAPGHSRLNSAIGGILLFLYAGFGWKKMRSAHFDHHRHVGAEGDPDFDTANPRDGLRWYTTFLKRYFGWQSALYVLSVVALYWLVVGVPIEQIILVYGLPAIASSVQLFYFGTYRPHHHDDASFEDQHNARSNDFPGWLSLATCFHFGYHLEHHRHPNVPWWALPAQRRSELQRARNA